MPKLKSYLFSCGNSTDGPIGFCVRVKAVSKRSALKILHEALPETIDARPFYDHGDHIEYCQVYISTENITEADIEHIEETDEEASETPLQAFAEQAWEDDEAIHPPGW